MTGFATTHFEVWASRALIVAYVTVFVAAHSELCVARDLIDDVAVLAATPFKLCAARALVAANMAGFAVTLPNFVQQVLYYLFRQLHCSLSLATTSWSLTTTSSFLATTSSFLVTISLFLATTSHDNFVVFSRKLGSFWGQAAMSLRHCV